MKYINKLTKEQEEMISVWRDKWIAKGLQTGETDWTTFEKYIPICYQKAEIRYPNNIIKVSSPLVGALAAMVANAVLKKNNYAASPVDGAVGAVGVAVSDAVDSAVNRSVGGAVKGAVRDVVDDAVGDAVGAVSGAVDNAVSSAVDGAVRDAVDLLRFNGIKDASWHYWLGGQFWVGGWWGSPSFVSFFREVCGLELDQDIEERAEAYQKVCESVNYIWLNSHFTMVCARPTEIHRDDQGRLHNENGLAIKYLDGWGLYVINGVTVNEQIVLRPETLTINQIQKESNQEKRRIMIERFGVDKYLQAINATIVDVDMRGVIGAGARALMKDDKGDCWFIGTDGSTDRVYNMYVGQGYTTCKEAHEALCGFSESLIKAEG